MAITTRAAAILCALIAAGTAVAAPAAAAPGDPVIVAHRHGAHPGLTENGMPALEESARLGFIHVEVDVRTTASGTPVAMHDATLDRTTTGTGTVATVTNRKLATYALDDGSAVPSIRQVLRYTAGHGVTVFLDVKALTRTGWVRLGSALSDTRAVVRFTGRPRWTNRAEQRFPGVTSFPIIAPGQVVPAYADGVSVNYTRVTQEHVTEIRSRGLDYYTFTPNDPADQSRLTGMGVTGLIVDDPP